MMGPSRRVLLAAPALSLLFGAAVPSRAVPSAAAALPSRRPPPGQRRFTSPAVERTIAAVLPRIADPVLRWMFANCFPNTLDTAVTMGRLDGQPDSFVVTGDIDALWLRDSAAQITPYVMLARTDPALRLLCRGLIARHARCLLIDPYANAFLRDPAGTLPLPWARHDLTEMRPGIAERKWELDSLCHVIDFAHRYWRATGDARPFDRAWHAAMRSAVATMRAQQRLHDVGPYSFQRISETPTETQFGAGHGNPTRKIGLIHSMFRPSDDACLYPFLVPSNLFAVNALRRLAAMLPQVGGDPALAADCAGLADQVDRALKAHATIPTPDGPVWAYELDGYGNRLFMDDANTPSLLGLPLVGAASPDDPLYRRTRARAWSDDNPWFFRGSAGEGIGGPHEGARMIWPMSIIVLAMTSTDDAEMRRCLFWLKTSQAGTGLMHESFDEDDPARFTRPWFGWANGLFGSLILDLLARRSAVLAEKVPS